MLCKIKSKSYQSSERYLEAVQNIWDTDEYEAPDFDNRGTYNFCVADNVFEQYTCREYTESQNSGFPHSYQSSWIEPYIKLPYFMKPIPACSLYVDYPIKVIGKRGSEIYLSCSIKYDGTTFFIIPDLQPSDYPLEIPMLPGAYEVMDDRESYRNDDDSLKNDCDYSFSIYELDETDFFFTRHNGLRLGDNLKNLYAELRIAVRFDRNTRQIYNKNGKKE